MAAGQGFKTFTTGEVLTAGDVNGYLMQGINVFTNATARDAAITAPAEGQFAFTKDNNSLWYYDGAAWVASGATGDIEGVTAGVGISGGGTSGTVTITNSMATAIDAKGDLVAGTGADTFSRIAVGANDTVLTADSTTATGLKWAAAASGSTFSGVKLNASGSQLLSNNTETALIFNVEDFDTDGFHSNTTNNTRITIPSGKAGYYQIGGLIDFDNGAGAGRVFLIRKNNVVNKQHITTPNTVYPSATIETILYLAVGDYVELFATQNAGSSQNVYLDGANGQFYAYYIGA